ncbi:outer membrane beta-barrel protein [Fuchsiella alkaliacetigena]|uniref:outer membrane beta-barrel protein n=1 Tax=Fuchsiella alkaliacetigena TaxID=957042 RepID=UPI00200AC3E8|nr:outer membrane beta-barrel protein [Fuchsiella alkaliacetigena]MCK8826022.1 porin family protein [Fuchsiella alkaliacetigena]
MKRKFLIIVAVVLTLSLISSVAFANEDIEKNQDQLLGFDEEKPSFSAYAGVAYDMLELSEVYDNDGVAFYTGGRKWLNDDIAVGLEGEAILASSDFNHSDFPTEGVKIFNISGLFTYEVLEGIYAIGGVGPYFASFDDGDGTFSDNTIGLKVGAEANFALTEDINLVGRIAYREAEIDDFEANDTMGTIDISGSQIGIGATMGF